jgi:tRNA(fMet)-specific endonuclease VapC
VIYLPDTNACITLLRGHHAGLVSRWQATAAADVATCAIVAYELRYGAERSAHPAREQAKLDVFLEPFVCLPFDDACARMCAQIRHTLERAGQPIGPHDLQIAAVAVQHDLILVTHNVREFRRIDRLKTEDWEG